MSGTGRRVLALVSTFALGVATALSDEGPFYDPSAVETLAGSVAWVERVPSAHGRSREMNLVLKTDAGETIGVVLGPEWVVERTPVRIVPGDRIQVTGVRVVRGKPTLLAAEVRKGDEVLKLRDRRGVPVWGRSRRVRPAG